MKTEMRKEKREVKMEACQRWREEAEAETETMKDRRGGSRGAALNCKGADTWASFS